MQTRADGFYGIVFLLVLLLGLCLRLVFFSGFFGSDEVTYTERAVAWLLGDHSIPEYVGANRLGVTLPVAALMGVLGRTEFTANLWSLACSMGELVLVWSIGLRIGGKSLAIPATLLLALTPLHIHYSGRLMADAPVSFFLTLSAAAILLGRNDKLSGPLLSGMAAGFVFWIKPPVVIFSIVMLGLMILERRPLRHYVAWGAAAGTIVALNFAMMWIYAGDPLFILKTMSKRLDLVVTMGAIDKRPHAYLVWLLADMRFTWLLGWFALVGLFVSFRDADLRPSAIKVLLWLTGLILVFSLWPASLKPFDLIFKQSNYMTMFLAPAALAGGFLIGRFSPIVGIAMLALYGLGGIFLAALLQADIQTFTANARAIPTFTKQQPDATYYMGTVGDMSVEFDKVLAAPDLDAMRLSNVKPLAAAAAVRSGEKAVAVVDPISGPHRRDPRISESWPNAKCWTPIGLIQPIELSYLARTAVRIVRALLAAMPVATLRERADSFMSTPPATVFGFEMQCEIARESTQ
jgi:hypothetical protein